MLLEEKRRSYAYRDAHLEAIFWHNGKRYKVVSFDDETRTIVCTPSTADDLRTQGLEEVELVQKQELEPVKGLAEDMTLGFGEVRLTTSILSYLLYQTTNVMRCRNRQCRYESTNLDLHRCPRCGGPLRPRRVEKVIERLPVPQPPVLSTTLDTQASWLDFSGRIAARFAEEFWPRWSRQGAAGPFDDEVILPDFEAAVHSAKHALLKALPDRIRCDESDIGGMDLPAQGGQGRRLYIYDNFSGGLGLAESLYDNPQTLLSAALELIERCNCDEDEGCVVCLKYFRCHKFNSSLSKLAGRYVLRLALALPVKQVLTDLADYVVTTVPRGAIAEKPVREARRLDGIGWRSVTRLTGPSSRIPRAPRRLARHARGAGPPLPSPP